MIMNKHINLIKRSFQPILILLHITGLESLPHEVFSKNSFLNFVLKCLQYLFSILECVAVASQLIASALLLNNKVHWVLFILVLLEIIANLQTRKSRKQIHLILMTLQKCTQKLQCFQDGRKFRTSIFAYFAVMFGLNISYIMSYFYSSEGIVFKTSMKNSQFASQEVKQFFIFVPEILSVAFPALTALVFISLTGYYGFVCFYAKFLFNRIEEKIKNLSKDCSCMPIIDTYVELTTLLKSLDDYLSFSAFVIVVSSLAGLFYVNFGINFLYVGDVIHFLSAEIWFSTLVCMIILSASAVNSASLAAKEAIYSLPGKIPRYYYELDVIIRSDCMRDVSLNLWKIYKIDRSLLLSALGTLITYGMLLVTMGSTIKSKPPQAE
ncbi:uncharacterized protein TNCT_205271 [Trichonephila clavata]|uniref:Gustatory receptor n=1 Tax=Trichonephila clavata TaxID=2740835 RepID=A0A8X6L565_TRICU|nr:uncharacterized protein TNCT_205271 [Trichonephila clavata]